jgi:hypothetical protein
LPKKTDVTFQNQSKPKPDRKNLDADFSDWIQPTRNFADETKAD